MKSKMQKTEVNSHHEHVQGFPLRILISVVLKEKGTGMTNTVVYIGPITSKVINLHAAFRHSRTRANHKRSYTVPASILSQHSVGRCNIGLSFKHVQRCTTFALKRLHTLMQIMGIENKLHGHQTKIEFYEKHRTHKSSAFYHRPNSERCGIPILSHHCSTRSAKSGFLNDMLARVAHLVRSQDAPCCTAVYLSNAKRPHVVMSSTSPPKISRASEEVSVLKSSVSPVNRCLKDALILGPSQCVHM